MYTLKVVAETEEGETVTIKRKFRIGLPCHMQPPSEMQNIALKVIVNYENSESWN